MKQKKGIYKLQKAKCVRNFTLFKIKQQNESREKDTEEYGFKRERPMRYCTLKTMKKYANLEKVVGRRRSVALQSLLYNTLSRLQKHLTQTKNF